MYYAIPNISIPTTPIHLTFHYEICILLEVININSPINMRNVIGMYAKYTTLHNIKDIVRQYVRFKHNFHDRNACKISSIFKNYHCQCMIHNIENIIILGIPYNMQNYWLALLTIIFF